MWRHASVLFVVMTASCLSAPAQTSGTVAQPDPGVFPTTLMDRAEVRVLRVEIKPGATRRVHVHSDVRFHLFVPVTGTVQLSIESENPVEAAPGQVHFLKANTPHGFKNTGALPATVIELFIKDGAPRADQDALAALALGLAAIPMRK